MSNGASASAEGGTPKYLEGILFCLGNPLLDISAEVDDAFLEKYGLKQNDAILADDKHKSMYDDLVEKFTVEYVPGGATQNTARLAQWLIGIPHATTYMGCIGKDDKYGQILQKKVDEAGVRAVYQITEKEPTGTCAVLITGKSRSLVAYLAAANHFTIDHLKIPENTALLEKAKFFYISGFVLTVSPDSMVHVGKHAADNDKLFAMNLSAPFLCAVFKSQMDEVLPYVDIVFGNETETLAYSEAHGFGLTDLKEIGMRIARLPKQNGKKGRIIVITQGAGPTIVIKEGKISEYPVIHIDPKDIVDTNGAGDAFVGGFLAQLVQDGSMEDCLRSANYAANLIIQRSGCTYPEKHNFGVGVF